MSCATNAYSLGAIAPAQCEVEISWKRLAKTIAFMIDMVRETGERRRAAHLMQPDDGQ
jgi:hypothetical protein